MRKNIARKLAILLAMVLFVTTFGSDYNSIGVRASDEDATLQADLTTEVNEQVETDGFWETQEEEPSVEEEISEPEEEAVEESVPEETPEEATGEEVQEEDAAPAEEVAEEPTTEDAAPAEETPAETPEEAPAEETPAEVAPAETPDEAPAEETPAEETPAENPEDAAPAEEALAEEIAEEAAEAVEEAYPEKEFNGGDEDISVYVFAPEGAFPEGTTMSVTKVTEEATLDVIKNAADSSVDNDKQIVYAADISFKNAKGEDIEPKVPIQVKMTTPKVENVQDAALVHVDDNNSAEVINDADIKANGAEFTSDEFSIYAIVVGPDSPEEVYKRRTYKFQDEDGTPFVFKNESGVEVDNQIIRSGESLAPITDTPSHANKQFEGWYEYKDGAYTDNKVEFETPITFEITEDEEIILRAKYTTRYIITYRAPNGAVIASKEVTGNDGNYTVEMTYETEHPDTQAFLGWKLDNPEQASSISVVEEMEGKPVTNNVYPNGTKIKVKDNITFNAYVASGNWLVFHENGKGASYTPAKFYEGGETTVRPSKDPTRKGYTFVGWYLGKPTEEGGEPTGSEFTFGNALTEYTNLYAKWQAADTASYTVVIWKLGLDGEPEYAESVALEGTVGTTIDDEIIKINDADCSVNINGVKYGGPDNPKTAGNTPMRKYIGFKPVRYDQGKKINAEGNTIVNVYFDRIEYNFQFRVAYYRGNQTWAWCDGSRTAYTGGDNRHPNNLNVREGDAGTVRGTGLDSDGNNASFLYFTITAKYGEDINTNPDSSRKWPDYSRFEEIEERNSYVMVSWILDKNASAYTAGNNQGGETVKGKITIMDEQLLGNWKDPNANFVDARYDNNPYNYSYYICQEKADAQSTTAANTPASGYTLGATVVYNRVQYEVKEIVPSKANSNFTGQKAPSYTGFTALKNGDNFVYTQLYDRTNRERGLAFYYSRNKADIDYMDGAYVDGNGSPVKGIVRYGTIKHVTGIEYGADLSTYNQGKANYFDPTNYSSTDPEFSPYEGFVFAGWYKDETCTDPYTFTTMGNDSIIVYAKWIVRQYRIFLHPNAYEKDNVTLKSGYGIGNQGLSFRADYNGTITATSPTADDYEFRGWYSDPDLKNLFSIDSKNINDDVTVPYGKTEETELVKGGAGEVEPGQEGVNADTDRFWIERKLDLYASWGQKLIGADGINVVYDIDGDIETVTDEKLYSDNSAAVAKECPANKVPQGKRFAYWVVQKYVDGEFVPSEDHASAGKSFTVYKNYAEQKEAEGHTEENPKYIYTVKLVPKFVDDSEPDIKVTRIIYDGNGDATKKDATTSLTSSEDDKIVVSDDKTVVTYKDKQLNEKIEITDQGFTRSGYIFLGWSTDKNAETAQYEVGNFVGVNNIGVTVDESGEYDYTVNTLYAVWEKEPAYPFTVNYYVDSVSDENFIGQEFHDADPERPEVTLTDEELNAKKPMDYGYSDGEQQGDIPRAIDAPDIVIDVVYTTYEITVSIKGDQKEFTYDGTAKTAEGWTITSIKEGTTEVTGDKLNTLKSKVKLAEGVTAKVEETDVKYDGDTVDKYLMGLKGTPERETDDPCSFEWADSDFTNVKFVMVGGDLDSSVKDGYLKINPITDKIIVSIKGKQVETAYTGSTRSTDDIDAEGFEDAGFNNGFKVVSILTEDETPVAGISATEDIALAEGKTASAEGVDANTEANTEYPDYYPMNLTPEHFICNNTNYTNVEFKIVGGDLDEDVEDGYIKITPVEGIVVTLQGNEYTAPYDGTVRSTSIFTSKPFSVTSITKDGEAFTGITASDIAFKVGVSANAEGTDVSETPYTAELTADMFECTNSNFKIAQYNIDGPVKLYITPINVVVKVKGHNNDEDGTIVVPFDNEVHTSKGFDIGIPAEEGAINADYNSCVFNDYDPVEVAGKYFDVDKDVLFDDEAVGEVKGEKPEVSTKYPDRIWMNLDQRDEETEEYSRFKNTNGNFIVTFVVEDGYVVVEQVGFIKLKATAIDSTEVFTGKTWTGADFDYIITSNGFQEFELQMKARAVNPLKSVVKAIANIFSKKETTAETPHEFTVDGFGDGKFNLTGLSVKVGEDDRARDVKDGGYDLTVIKPEIIETQDGVDFGIKIVDEEGTDVTYLFDVYDIELVTGNFKITPADITITSDSATKVYDGTPLTAPNATVSPALAEGDVLTYTFPNSQTEVGSIANEFTYVEGNEQTKLSNYNITKALGMLLVTAKADVVPPPAEPTPTPTPEPEDDDDDDDKPARRQARNNTPYYSGFHDTVEEPKTDEAVLGAKREEPAEEEAGVLGARRGGTADTTDPSRVLVLLFAAGAVATLLVTGKRRKEEE